MITENLFDSLLLDPVLQNGANKLFIVSGYATSAMAFHHLDRLKQSGRDIQVDLVVGMCGQDGLSKSNHRGFQQLMGTDFAGHFQCSYLVNTIPVHSKVYAWYRDDAPVVGFTGSANYTQKAFGNAQREAMAESNPVHGLSYFQRLTQNTIYCVHTDAEEFVQIYNDKYFARQRREVAQQDDQRIAVPVIPSLAGLETVRVSLLAQNGEVGRISGLNWGQRPGRNPNQAYIGIPAVIARRNFFPVRRQHFTVLTDDGRVLICTIAQDNDKAIETPQNNSLIGEYFRNRLGLGYGDYVNRTDLERYGRTNVDFYKIDDETYYMDFSVPINGQPN